MLGPFPFNPAFNLQIALLSRQLSSHPTGGKAARFAQRRDLGNSERRGLGYALPPDANWGMGRIKGHHCDWESGMD